MSEETNTAQIVLYQSEGANVPVEVSYMQGTFWMPQRRIAELFGTTKQLISYHLGNIFKDGELEQNSVVKEILTTAADGKNYRVKFYSLDAILAVGYRVSSAKAVKFRQWATATLKEYVKSFCLPWPIYREPVSALKRVWSVLSQQLYAALFSTQRRLVS